MSYVTQLAPEATAPVDQPVAEPSKQVIIDGVDRRDEAGNVIASESAPVGGESVDVASAAQTVTPVVESGTAAIATPPEVAQEAATAPAEPVEKPAAPEAQ